MDKKVSVFGRDTGKFLIYGDRNSPKVRRLIAEGHVVVEGRYNHEWKRRPDNGEIIPDAEVLQAKADNITKRSNNKNARKELKKLKGDSNKQQEAIDYIIELLT